MTPQRQSRILIVDDDLSIRASLGDALASSGMELEFAESGEQAITAIQRSQPDLMISDVRMPGLSGLDVLKTLRERGTDIDVVLITAFDDMHTVVTAMRHGAVEFLVKPIDLHELRMLVRRVIDDRHARRRSGGREEPEVSASHGAELIGRDPQMIEVFKLVGQAASTRANVLIRGDSGTGKELIARAIHANSEQATQPFVAVNCTALPAGLLESELFGHVRGAFTGASSSRRGRFALAGRGTIFLDEIGDTSAEFQTKLLRVLEDREFYPVGAERPERTDARVIAATHRDLDALVAENAFRGDLFYRLDVFVIKLPPLRERPDDIPLLAKHFLRHSSAALGRSVRPVISDEALDELSRREWPGNVRELENTLTRALMLAAGEVIRPEHLSPASHPRADEMLTLAELERGHLSRVLAATQGHKAKTAEILGISRPRLDRLIEKYGL